ncbi:MAG: hypothetical protein ACK5HA_13740 [Planctomycetaceae bacterium]
MSRSLLGPRLVRQSIRLELQFGIEAGLLLAESRLQFANRLLEIPGRALVGLRHLGPKRLCLLVERLLERMAGCCIIALQPGIVSSLAFLKHLQLAGRFSFGLLQLDIRDSLPSGECRSAIGQSLLGGFQWSRGDLTCRNVKRKPAEQCKGQSNSNADQQPGLLIWQWAHEPLGLNDAPSD